MIVEKGDVTDLKKLTEIVERHEITEIYHLASLLSANGEIDPSVTFNVNLIGLKNILDLAIEKKLKIFWPSSIGKIAKWKRNLTTKFPFIQPLSAQQPHATTHPSIHHFC